MLRKCNAKCSLTQYVTVCHVQRINRELARRMIIFLTERLRLTANLNGVPISRNGFSGQPGAHASTCSDACVRNGESDTLHCKAKFKR
jgi:hypothetical protein